MDMNVDTSVNNDRSRPLDDNRELDNQVEDRQREPRAPVSVRDTLRKSFADARREEEPAEEETREDTRSDRDRQERDRGEDVDTEVEASTSEDTELDQQAPKPRNAQAAPAAWTKDAKAEWANLPDKVKQAVIKREKDTERGVESLKNQYAEIDQAIAPYSNTIRQFNKSPGQAVAQLFAWFDALAKDPDQAFPALLQSYRYDPRRLMAAYGIDLDKVIQVHQQMQNGQQQQNGQVPPQQQQGQPEEQISPAVQAYINRLEEKLNGFQSQVGQTFNGMAQSFAEQQQAKTHEMLDQWSNDKPYFEDVRVMMGHLLTPDPNTGQAAVPLKDGRVDLDEAYSRACWMIPEIREQMLADQDAQREAARQAKLAEQQRLQQEKAAKARRASGSVTTSAPGVDVSRKPAPPKGMSVRDSLKQAISELSER